LWVVVVVLVGARVAGIRGRDRGGATVMERARVVVGADGLHSLVSRAVVGDAGYNKDFITAQGIQDAFRDAELCVHALDEACSGRRPFQEAMADFARVNAGVISPREFFSEENVRGIFAAAR
jgi:2-polyprenyl-6-methoxyphenol hydroxylase-like FAD-dependent oxidoreductase